MLQVKRLFQATDIQRLPPELCDEAADRLFGGRIRTAEHHHRFHVVAQIDVVLEILKAVNGECFYNFCFWDELLHGLGTGLRTIEPMTEPRTHGIRAIHQNLSPEFFCHGFERLGICLKGSGEKHDVCGLYRLLGCGYKRLLFFASVLFTFSEDASLAASVTLCPSCCKWDANGAPTFP